jgi:hypothetical protein
VTGSKKHLTLWRTPQRAAASFAVRNRGLKPRLRGRSGTLNPNSEVNFGEAEFPHPKTMKEKALYQGTASAVPNRCISWALAPAIANLARKSFSRF